MWKAYQGPNGWYSAYTEHGTHQQPANGGTLTKERAEREADRKNLELCDDHVAHYD